MEGDTNTNENERTLSTTDSNINTNDEEAGSGCGYFCCDPRGRGHRFIALGFMCFLGFGSYFCYDNPASLEKKIITNLNLTTTEYTYFYSMYSWPNVILCFIGGFLVDRVFGIRLGANIYMLLTLLGQAFFATGAMFNIFALMVFGRFIFGIGGESLAVAQNNYAVLWFKGKELNMVFGLQLSFARLGSTVNFWVMEPIYNWVNSTRTTDDEPGYEILGISLYIAGLTCIGSMFCSIILGLIDRRADKILRRSEQESGEVVRITDIKDFPLPFWLLAAVCVSFYVAIFPFIALGQNFFMERFDMSAHDANKVNSIVYLISAFASPVLGFIVDRTGRNIFWVILAIILTACAHVILAFTYLNPYVGMSLMGISYSLLASGLWPLVSFIIPERQLGTAYGATQAIQNLGLAVISLLAGWIADNGGYTWVEIFFIGSLGVSLLATIFMWFVDMSRGGVLNMTPGQRRSHTDRQLTTPEDEERLLADNASSSSSTAENPLRPSSDFDVRNRYYSRLGGNLPNSYDPHRKAVVYTNIN